MTMEFYETVNARYSVRRYSAQPVSDEVVGRVLEAARLAPSACNYQPWHFFVVRDAETRRRLFPNPHQAWVAEAPVVLVACSVPERAWVRRYDGKNHADVDVAIAMEHIVLAATAEGLGTCWICAFDPKLFREVLELPAEMEPVAATPLGYAAVAPGERSRKPLEEIVTWR
ncbi:MAG: nitroreductase family protein [Armatimonadota bacterium]|nr:nitroreductase family protein [Armatimonadota bacterium]